MSEPFYGSLPITDTSAHTGKFQRIIALTTASVTAVGNPTLTTLSIPAGTEGIRGRWTSITLASGTVIAEYSKDN